MNQFVLNMLFIREQTLDWLNSAGIIAIQFLKHHAYTFYSVCVYNRKPSTREFIGYALEARLRMILPYIDTWPQAMAIQTLPQNAVESWTNLANLVDEVWYYAGDRSVDVSKEFVCLMVMLPLDFPMVCVC